MRKLELKALRLFADYINIIGNGFLRMDYSPICSGEMIIQYKKAKNSKRIEGIIKITKGNEVFIEGINKDFVNYITKELK